MIVSGVLQYLQYSPQSACSTPLQAQITEDDVSRGQSPHKRVGMTTIKGWSFESGEPIAELYPSFPLFLLSQNHRTPTKNPWAMTLENRSTVQFQDIFAQAHHGRMEEGLGDIFKPGVPIIVPAATITWNIRPSQIPSSWDTNQQSPTRGHRAIFLFCPSSSSSSSTSSIMIFSR